MDLLSPKTPHLPFVGYPEKELRGVKPPGEELPNVPKPRQKEGEAIGDGPTETLPLCSHCLIPNSSGVRDSEQATPVQGAGSSSRLQSPKGQTRIAAAP